MCIQRTSYIRLLCLFISLLLGYSHGLNAETTTQQQPNFVFIYADDLGYGDIGVYGANDVATPHIDKLAADGIKFSDFYSASPVCSPSRAALLTGRYPVRMGIRSVFSPQSYTGMPVEEITVAELLQQAGYSTGIIGKWHLGHRDRFLPLNQGFQEFFGMPYSNDMYPYPYMRGNDYIPGEVDQTQVTKRLTEEAISFINTHQSKPFFLYIPHPMPHVPLYRSPEFENKSERGLYGDVIEELDWSVGQVIDALRKRGLLENTLLVFSSDNGPWRIMGDHGGSSGTTYNQPASMMDWFPTFLNLAGIEIPEGLVLDGKDISNILTGNSSDTERELAYYSTSGELQGYRVGDWKIKLPYQSSIPVFIQWFLREELQLKSHDLLLFNLQQDPGETNNLVEEYPEKAEQLMEAVKQFEQNLGELPPGMETHIITPLIPEPILMTVSKSFSSIVVALLITFGLLMILVFGIPGYIIGKWRR